MQGMRLKLLRAPVGLCEYDCARWGPGLVGRIVVSGSGDGS